jgi:hypothetical protein
MHHQTRLKLHTMARFEEAYSYAECKFLWLHMLTYAHSRLQHTATTAQPPHLLESISDNLPLWQSSSIAIYLIASLSYLISIYLSPSSKTYR